MLDDTVSAFEQAAKALQIRERYEKVILVADTAKDARMRPLNVIRAAVLEHAEAVGCHVVAQGDRWMEDKNGPYRYYRWKCASIQKPKVPGQEPCPYKVTFKQMGRGGEGLLVRVHLEHTCGGVKRKRAVSRKFLEGAKVAAVEAVSLDPGSHAPLNPIVGAASSISNSVGVPIAPAPIPNAQLLAEVNARKAGLLPGGSASSDGAQIALTVHQERREGVTLTQFAHMQHLAGITQLASYVKSLKEADPMGTYVVETAKQGVHPEFVQEMMEAERGHLRKKKDRARAVVERQMKKKKELETSKMEPASKRAKTDLPSVTADGDVPMKEAEVEAEAEVEGVTPIQVDVSVPVPTAIAVKAQSSKAVEDKVNEDIGRDLKSLEHMLTRCRELRRCYCAFGASKNLHLFGRHGMSVGARHLTGLFRGTLLLAMDRDGNNDPHLMAVAFVPLLSTATWTWFMNKLLADFPNVKVVTADEASIYEDLRKALNSIPSVDSSRFLTLCASAGLDEVRRLCEENGRKLPNSPTIEVLFRNAVAATTPVEYENNLELLKQACIQHADKARIMGTLSQIKPDTVTPTTIMVKDSDASVAGGSRAVEATEAEDPTNWAIVDHVVSTLPKCAVIHSLSVAPRFGDIDSCIKSLDRMMETLRTLPCVDILGVLVALARRQSVASYKTCGSAFDVLTPVACQLRSKLTVTTDMAVQLADILPEIVEGKWTISAKVTGRDGQWVPVMHEDGIICSTCPCLRSSDTQHLCTHMAALLRVWNNTPREPGSNQTAMKLFTLNDKKWWGPTYHWEMYRQQTSLIQKEPSFHTLAKERLLPWRSVRLSNPSYSGNSRSRCWRCWEHGHWSRQCRHPQVAKMLAHMNWLSNIDKVPSPDYQFLTTEEDHMAEDEPASARKGVSLDDDIDVMGAHSHSEVLLLLERDADSVTRPSAKKKKKLLEELKHLPLPGAPASMSRDHHTGRRRKMVMWW